MLRLKSAVLLCSIWCIHSFHASAPRISHYFQLLPFDIINLLESYLRSNKTGVETIFAIYTYYTDIKSLCSSANNSEKMRSFFKEFDQKMLATAFICPVQLVSPEDKNYMSRLLIEAVLENNTTLAKILLYAGADCQFSTCKGSSLLGNAAQAGYTSMVDLLLKHGADPNPHKTTKNNAHEPVASSPLICGLRGNTCNTRAVVKLLLDAGTEQNTPDATGLTAMAFIDRHPVLANASRARELLANYRKKH